jgi:alkaline phosphatase
MRSLYLTSAFAQAALSTIAPRNFIYIIPDGLSPASITVARAYEALMNGEATPERPLFDPIFIDQLPVGNVRTHSADNMVTDSAAAGTALAAGYKTNNYMIGVDQDEEPVGTVLEAAKMAGMKTGLVVTSVINHATPAAFSAHTLDRDGYSIIAAQQVGYSHPLEQNVDILMGGGACYFRPQDNADSCREDDVDLLSHAESLGYHITEDRAGFDTLERGQGDVKLPILGLYNNNTHLAYEIDRQQQLEESREPSLTEMTEVALNALSKATACKGRKCRNTPGYFIMIEASRIDHALHANDPVAHLHDVLEYNHLIEFVKDWIDQHPDTAMISVADHECGGLTLPAGWDPRPLSAASHSAEFIQAQVDAYEEGGDKASFFAEQFESYGLGSVINAITAASLVESEDFELDLVNLMNEETGMHFSTDGHTAVDVVLYAYAHGNMGDQLRRDLAGNHDNTEIPRLIEKYLRLDMDEVTRRLREDMSWLE